MMSVEIRDGDGNFLGVLTMTAPPDYRSINVPIVRPFSAVRYDPVPPQVPPQAIFGNIIRFDRARWYDPSDGIRYIWRYDGDVAKLTDAKHVILKCATSPTWLDREIRYYETLKRVFALVIFYKMPACKLRVH